MATPTSISLSPEARALVAKRMAARGETAGTYFSNPDTESVSGVAPGAPIPMDPEVVAYHKSRAEIGARQGMEDVGVTMGLFDTPRNVKTARWLEANLGAAGLTSGEQKGSYYVPGFTDKSGKVSGNSSVTLSDVAALSPGMRNRLNGSKASTPDQGDARTFARLLSNIDSEVGSAATASELRAAVTKFSPSFNGPGVSSGFGADNQDTLAAYLMDVVNRSAPVRATALRQKKLEGARNAMGSRVAEAVKLRDSWVSTPDYRSNLPPSAVAAKKERDALVAEAAVPATPRKTRGEWEAMVAAAVAPVVPVDAPMTRERWAAEYLKGLERRTKRSK